MQKIAEIIKTKTLRQSSVTFLATVINGALGAVFYILAARILGPASFGILGVSITVLTLGASVGGLGVNTGLVRFVSKHKDKKPKTAQRFLKLALEANLVIGFAIAVLGVVFAEELAVGVFNKPDLVVPLRISGLGVFALLLFGFATRTLEAFQRFVAWGALLVGTNLARVGVVLLFFVMGMFTIENSMWIYALLPFFGFLMAIVFVLPKDFYKVKNETAVAREFFHYNKWIAGFTLIASFSSRVDTFLVARMMTAESVGIYTAAYQLVYIVPQIVAALGTVFAPKMASFASTEEFLKFFKKSQLLVSGLAFLGILAAPAIAFATPYIFGPEYAAAVPVFYILLLAMLIFLISVPVHNAVLYYFAYPKLFLWLGIGHLVVVSFLGWFLIGSLGIGGAALAVLAGCVFNLFVPALWVYLKLR